MKPPKVQVIASDFARLQAETQAAEEAAKAEYEEFMEDSKVPTGAKGMPRRSAVTGKVEAGDWKSCFVGKDVGDSLVGF